MDEKGAGDSKSATLEKPVVWIRDETSGIIEVSIYVENPLTFKEWEKRQQDNHVTLSEATLKDIKGKYGNDITNGKIFDFKILPSPSTATIETVDKKATGDNLAPLTLNEMFLITCVLKADDVRAMDLKWLLFIGYTPKNKAIEFDATDRPEIKISDLLTVFNSQVGFVYKQNCDVLKF